MNRRLVPIFVALIVAVSGCASTKQVTPQDVDALNGIAESGAKGNSVKGFTTIDGVHHEYDGRVRIASGDTLEFFRGRKPRSGWGVDYGRKPAEPIRIPRDSVQTIDVHHTNAAGTIFATLAVTVLVVAVAVGIALATKESCPFLYSYDGEHFVFDGEPYGGATMSSLERTDWSELEHLRPVDGRYRLRIGNEVDETQHTNSLALRVVDHRPGTVVVIDKQGQAHAFQSLISLRAAYDEAGRDLFVWLKANDRAAWQPDLKTYAKVDSLADTHNHITLEFPRPKGYSKGYLITNVATHLWGSHMIRTMLAMRGSRVQEFYDAINNIPAHRAQLFAWNEREELFELFPEVETAAGWVRQGFIPAGGPFIGESRAIPLDWSGAVGEIVRVRIHPPIGFWSLESFHIACEETEAHDATLVPDWAEGPRGPAVLAALAADDSLYLDFPEVGDNEVITFRAPPAAAGMERSLFAQTRGWYEVHLHDLGEPDAQAIARLASEPGYAVRRSLSEFREFQSTGVLRGTKPAQREDLR